MILGRNEVPFPDNPHCKRCLSKNCRELLVQPLFPGKVIFVHRKRFCSIPDYIPSWRNHENAAPAEEAALTDDLEVVEGPVEITSPAWKHKDKELVESSPDKAAEGDTIILSAQVKHFPEGASVTFDIYDVSESQRFLISSVKGINEGGTAQAEWVVEDPQQKGEALQLAFEASARSKYSERTDIPLHQKLNCDFVEMPDVLFNHNSAVACLDKDGVLLSALSSAFIYAKNNAGREVVIFGHTDTSGDASYNYDLSQWRAEGIKALLDNDSETLLDIIDLASKVEDYQTFLTALAESHGWNCHPGAIDNIAGEKTKEALRNFQTEYNDRFKGDLKVDGTIGPKTWTAIFNVIHTLVEEIVKKECGEVPSLAYGYNSKGVYPCGESFPVDQAGTDGIKSKTNRRVEIVFFEQGKSVQLKEFADKSAGKKSEAVIYNKSRTTLKPVPVHEIQPQIQENRRIIFEEAIRTVEAVGVQTWWEPGPAKGRWIYVFGSSDGSNFNSVWEIKTSNSGKFATFKLTEENYNNRPAEEIYKDVALLPRNDVNGTAYFYFACLSEIRLDKERIFGKEGLLSDPLKRCLDIDDQESVSRKTDANGDEHVILMNYLKEAERLREQFDKIFPQWMDLRLPSSAESVESKKKEKLIYEYGALIMQIVSAYPDYKSQFDPVKFKSLENSVIETDARKASLTGEVIGKANILCDWIDTEKFTETCRDYLFLIKETESQSAEFETFENRIGALFIDLTRFSRGMEVLRKLLPEVKTGDQQTWLQDLLLLKNDSWNSTGEQLFGEQKGNSNGVKKFKNYRKMAKRIIDLLKEAAVSGAGVYSAQNMGKIIQKVLRTCGESVLLDVAPVSMKSVSGVRPFSQVMFSKSTDKVKNFWDFKFPKGEDPTSLYGKVLTSKTLDNIMNMLEGVSVAFGVWDVMNREYKSEVDAIKTAKDLLSLADFIWKVVLKKGKGTAYLISVVTNGFDAYIAFNDAIKAKGNYDYDSAFWNYVAFGSFTFSAIAGTGALVATFYAGAASVSATGIGVAPGVLLFAVGTIIAVAAKSAADMTKNTAIENLFVISPWGKHPEFAIENCGSDSIKKHHIKAITILNMFKVEIDVDYTVIKLLLRQLNSETIVTLKSIEFGSSSSGNNIQKTVGTNVLITEENCAVSELTDGRYCLTIDLGQVCKTRYDMYWLANKPDFVNLCATIDLKGDTTILLPDTNKSVYAQRYGKGETTITIQ